MLYKRQVRCPLGFLFILFIILSYLFKHLMKKYEQCKTIKIGQSQEIHKSSYILIAKALVALIFCKR